MYTPTKCKPLSESTHIPQIRLLLQGFFGTGKTKGALTFPNPVVLNLDRGLGGHQDRTDVIEVPFYDDNWVRDWSGDLAYNNVQLKDKLIKWTEQEAVKLTEEQTLVFDGNTGLQNAYHKWFSKNQSKFMTSAGQVDGFAEWKIKRQYYGELMELFKTLKCHVVFICHEVDQKDKVPVGMPVSYSGKIRPLLTGGFGDELGSHFTDVFRAHASSRPTDFKSLKPDDVRRDWGMTVAQYEQFCLSFPRNTIYYWQTDSDNIFDGKCSTLREYPKYLPPVYSSLLNKQ